MQQQIPYISQFKNRTILFSVLNWGLGHASRSIPIIEQLRMQNHVYIASDGIAAQLLEQHFNEPILKLPSYNINYSKQIPFWLNMVGQAPKIALAIKKEQKFIGSFCKKYECDLIVSDNRYGAYHPRFSSFIITHQTNLILPAILKFAAQAQLNRYLNKFDDVWIPDFEDQRLSGQLSNYDGPKRFIGPLTQLKKLGVKEKKIDVLCVLSGPEPSRTMLEKKLISILSETNYQAYFVRGTKTNSASFPFKHISLATSNEISELIASSKVVIGRPGYSSIMDYYLMQCKAMLIPTPGQTEQEYLARLHHDSAVFSVVKENELETTLAAILKLQLPASTSTSTSKTPTTEAPETSRGTR